MNTQRKHYRPAARRVEVPAPITAQELAEMWGKSGQKRATPVEEPAAFFFSALQHALHEWRLKEADYKSTTDRSAGLPKGPRDLLLLAVRQMMEGAQRREYWAVHAIRAQTNRLLALAMDTPETLAAVAAEEEPIKDRWHYLSGHWNRRLGDPDAPSRTVLVREGMVVHVRIVCYPYGRSLAIAAVLMHDDEPVLPDEACTLKYVPLTTTTGESTTPPSSEAFFWAGLIEKRREAGDEQTAEKLRQLARELGIPSVTTARMRLMQVAARRLKRRQVGTVTEIRQEVVVASTAAFVQSEGSLALTTGDSMAAPPSAHDVFSELAESMHADARAGVARLLGYLDAQAPDDVLQEQQRTFERLFDQSHAVINPILDDLAVLGVVPKTAITWLIDARNEWLTQELSRERAAHLGQGTAPDVERAMRRTRAPRSPSLLEQRARLAIGRGSGDDYIDALRDDIEQWLVLLDNPRLDPSVEKRAEQELFVRLKLWDLYHSKRGLINPQTAAQAQDASQACAAYLSKNAGRFLGALYRAQRVIRATHLLDLDPPLDDEEPGLDVDEGLWLPRISLNRPWTRARRRAPLAEDGDWESERLAIATIFKNAEEIAGFRSVDHRDLIVLQRLAAEYLRLRSKFRPLNREVQIRIARDLRVLTEVFHLALYSVNHARQHQDD